MSTDNDPVQIASQLLGADQATAHAIVSRLVVERSAILSNRADRPGGTAVFAWRNLEGQSEIGHVEAARDWARRFLAQEGASDSTATTGPAGMAGVDNEPIDPFTRLKRYGNG